ncbi:quaternary amine ABC transporter ATP-binding protein [Pseudomonas gingeri]|uniref:quaternary amine ABC transporter ATP-binding protein n=1 Tax=Pseudomonas gingeri TaxID=117681 RepID=UPI00159FE0C9|nr:glycine betaine/L-proline ABC transporter ATP-binding protein [Pseudomonas gingeri]NWE35633.1 glycine betaine/L-proline ABC transporter ATP-binding protein [Pseudomonas gingeri]NWE60857.1 glycine betaine/L-proline ABC transporter ATP-binding protein [Pseudomonas gingeri]NWF02835.1 glycine betaine/L-proline ABC transporter ATP-binding protein [Pseudomonas gingeri]
MDARLKIENLYKVFSPTPGKAMELLRKGASKDQVFSETSTVVGLNDVSLSVPSGAIYMIMGLSGSGKSTLARCINRLNEPTAGKIILDGQDIVPLKEWELREVRRTRISMVFQHFALLPNKSIIENTEFGLKLRGMDGAQRRKRAEEILSIVGLAKWAYHYPHELSGGMRQRVGLARALATDADVLIMDEAFSALDPLIRSEMQDELLRLQRTLKKTILFITHDFQEALKMGTRIAIMRDGQVAREGTPQDIVMSPGSDYVSGFTREVDRSRLFDASAVMLPTSVIHTFEGHKVLSSAALSSGGGIVVDSSNKIIGSLNAGAISEVAAGRSPMEVISNSYTVIPESSKLIDASRILGSSTHAAVVSPAGEVVGMLDAGNILNCIATVSSPGARLEGEQNA